jgi:hypothetical protein
MGVFILLILGILGLIMLVFIGIIIYMMNNE